MRDNHRTNQQTTPCRSSPPRPCPQTKCSSINALTLLQEASATGCVNAACQLNVTSNFNVKLNLNVGAGACLLR